MNKEVEIKNYKTVEEAKQILAERIESIEGDYIVIYKEHKEKEDEEEGLFSGEITEESLIREEYNLHQETVLMVGEKCKKAKVGDRVVLNPAAAYNVVPLIIGDVIFFLLSEMSIIAYLKDNA